METLTRLVSESMARHGFDRALDYRRLRWSRWFRCESHHSLLSVPSKPGVFAVAEEIMDLGSAHVGTAPWAVPRSAASGKACVGTAALGCPAERSSASAGNQESASPKPEAEISRRMLAVTQFFEDDDMAFTLDRMLSRENPMRARLQSGRYFIRYVVIEEVAQRRSICSALNQWMVSSAERATGIGSHFASSLELSSSDVHSPRTAHEQESNESSLEHVNVLPASVPQQSSGAAANVQHPAPFPSGF